MGVAEKLFQWGVQLLLPRDPAPKLSKIPMEQVRRIGILSNTALGDTLFSTPLFREVKGHFPDREVVGILHPVTGVPFKNSPYLDRVLFYDGRKGSFWKGVRQLRRAQIDLLLIAHSNEPEATPLGVLGGAKYILKAPNHRNPFARWHNNPSTPPIPGRHGIFTRLQLLRFLGVEPREFRPELHLPAEVRERVRERLHRAGVVGERLIGFQVGASTPTRRWPISRWVELGRELLRRYPEVGIVVTGGPGEEGLGEEVVAGIGGGKVWNWAGKLPLLEGIGLLGELELLIGPDTGPLHLAATLGVPTIGLFVVADPLGSNPFWDPPLHLPIYHPRPCPRCLGKRCKAPFCTGSIEVSEVLELVPELLGKKGSNPRR